AMQLEGQPVFRLTWVPVPGQTPIHRTRENITKYETKTSTEAVTTQADVERWEKREAEMADVIDRSARQHAAALQYIASQKGKYGPVEQETQRVTDGTNEGTRI